MTCQQKKSCYLVSWPPFYRAGCTKIGKNTKMKRIIQITSFVLFLSMGLNVMAQDMAAMMKQQMSDSILGTCNDQAFLSCMGISSKKCISAGKKTMAACDHLFPRGGAVMGDETAFDAHGKCMESHYPKNIGVSVSKLDACDPMGGGDSFAGEPPMDMEQSMAMMSQAFKQHAESIGTDDVTLPLYKNATILSHMRSHEMGRMYDDVENLSALKMDSPDSVKKIAKFYRSKLKGFREYKFQGGILFVENGPKDFNLMRDMKLYVGTPHVEIMPMQGGSKGSGSEIQISYK